MVIGSTIVEQWQARLAHLQRQMDARRDGPVWLWRIRIRILTYLLSRYGDAADPAAPATDPRLLRHPRPLRCPRFPRPDPPGLVEHPPRPEWMIRLYVHRLHAVNERRRFVQSVGRPDPETVWLWYTRTVKRSARTSPGRTGPSRA